MRGSRSVSDVRVIVGLDFGTTYTGYAFAHIAEPQDIFTFYEWKGAPQPYCKTSSEIYYKPAGFVKANGNRQYVSWGYPARAQFQRDSAAALRLRRPVCAGDDNDEITRPVIGTYLTRFKLHLAERSYAGPALSPASDLPEGVTVNRVISDYLRRIGSHVLNHLREIFGNHISMENVQWCVTVPSIWSNKAKQQMKECMINAGLVTRKGGSEIEETAASPHPLIMVLEPEAASCYCHRSIRHLQLQQGDKLLVADAGGGTTDIVVQEWVGDDDNFRVKEVTRSTGALCGGTYVDQRFITILSEKIECGGLTEYFQRFPTSKARLLNCWEQIKRRFSASDATSVFDDADIQLSQHLAREWEEHEMRLGREPRDVYDEIHLSYADMKRIFDPVVEEILELIAIQLSQTIGIKAIFVVGGFAASPYLISRIRDTFGQRVCEIVVPPQPGSAVCQGAVALALNPGGILTRIARKTYGIEVMLDFEEDVDPVEYQVYLNGVKKCRNRMQVFVQKDTSIDVDEYITKYFDMISEVMSIKLFSCDEANPRYITPDLCAMEGEIKIDISQTHDLKQQKVGVQVSMFFGRSSIEVEALVCDNTEQRSRESGKEVHQMEVPVTF